MSSRLAAQQQLVARRCRLLDQRWAEPATRHRGDRRESTEQLRQPLAAGAPLALQGGRPEPLDIRRMGMRVTPDRMAARCELAHPAGVEEAGRPDPAGDDEEVGAQAAALEGTGDLKRARAAVVECQREPRALVEQPRSHASVLERV
jgi:hypothetical protein